MNKRVIKIDSIFNFMYIFSYILFIVIKVLQNTLLVESLSSLFFSYSRYLIFINLAIIFIAKLANGMNKKNIQLKIIMIVLGIITYFLADNADCFCVMMFVALASDMDFKKIIKTSIITNILMLLFVIICCMLGKLPDYIYTHSSFLSFLPNEGHSLGFKYYSNAAFMILYISIMILFLKSNKKTILFVLFINIISLVVFTAKLPFFICIFYVALLVYFSKNRNYKISKKIWISFPILCILVSFFFSLIYNPQINLINGLNTLLNNRLKMGHFALENYGISLFGQKIIFQGTYALTYGKNVDWDIGYFFIDNDYLLLIITYGLFLSIIIMMIYCHSIKNTIENKNYKLFIWTISTLIFAFVNSSLISIEFNPILLVFMSLYYSDKSVMTKEKKINGI